MQQHRQTEGGAPRRSFTSPFATQAPPPYQQPQTSFLQYPIPLESAPRSYNQQTQMPPERYWQTPPGMDTSKHRGSLDLGEFGGILDTDTTGNEGATAETSGMNMTSFDVTSFHDTTGGIPTVAAAMHSRSQATAEPRQAHFTIRTKSTEITSASTDPAIVDAAYTQFSDSSNEPDLSAEKLTKDKIERCQFHDCPNRARVSQTYGKFCNRHVIVAPCGFPGCRDKAMERSAMCVKHMELGKEALQEILKTRSPNVPVCKMSGCFKNDQGRGYCRGHEKLLMATERLPPHINKRRLNSAYTMCSYPECNKHSQRHHLCRTHGNLIIKQAQELADRPGTTESYEEIVDRMQKEMRRCTHENCTKNSQRDRLCTTHYYEKHHMQKDNLALAKSTSVVVGSQEKVDLRVEPSGRSDVRAVERNRCGKPACGNLSYSAGLCVEHTNENQNVVQSQGHYGDPFSTGESGLFSGDVDSEANPGLLEKSQASGVMLSSNVSTMTNTTYTKCTNPMCDRNSFGRDYCEACQRLFSPLVVSINANSSAYSPNVPGIIRPEEKILLCRVNNCGQDCVRGGLCAAHLRAFRTGALSVDNIKLDSQAQQQQREQELAEASVTAAAAAEAKQASLSASGKARKYYCKIEGCDKQAQKRNLCKRHYRLQGVPEGKSQPEILTSGLSSNFVPGVPHPGFSHSTTGCKFPSCSQTACGGSLLCLAHSKVTFCWQPGCENLVDHQQFCEFHAFRQQCAYEGCTYSADRNSSGCMNHAMAQKCHHEFCDKFAVGSDSEWCRLHQISCQDSPCALCKLHALTPVGCAPSENENINRSRYNTDSTSKGLRGSNQFGRNSQLM